MSSGESAPYLGPPVATTLFSKPTALGASLRTLPVVVEPAGLPVTMSAISIAPCGFNCALRIQLRHGKFPPTHIRRRRPSLWSRAIIPRRTDGAPSLWTLFMKSHLVFEKSVGPNVNQSCIWAEHRPAPSSSRSPPRDHQAAESASTSPTTALHTAWRPARGRLAD